jgi:hypothetical protein
MDHQAQQAMAGLVLLPQSLALLLFMLVVAVQVLMVERLVLAV